MNQPELTQKALGILRNPETFQWYVIPLLACVAYIYFNEIEKRNWRAVAAGLSLYMVHWFFEIGNALIQHFTGHALWTVPTGTSFLLLVGVCVEISFMFSVAGVIFTKILPRSEDEDPGRQQPDFPGHRQCRLLLDLRDIPRAHAGLPLGLSVVGVVPGVRDGVHPVLPRGEPRLRLGAAPAEGVHRRVVRR